MRLSKNATITLKVKMPSTEPTHAHTTNDHPMSLAMIVIIVIAALLLFLCVLVIIIWRLEKLCFTKTKYKVDEAKENVNEVNEEILFTQYAEVNKMNENNDGFNDDSIFGDEIEADEEEHEVNMDMNAENETLNDDGDDGKDNMYINHKAESDNDRVHQGVEYVDRTSSDDDEDDFIIETYVTDSVAGDNSHLF